MLGECRAKRQEYLMATRAIQFLKRKMIRFEVVRYPHGEKGAEFAALSIGFPLEQTVKTLVADLGDGRSCLALTTGNRRLDLKLLAAVFGVKRAALADTATAERLTGYLVGGISPFGTKQTFPTVLDEPIRKFDTVMINGGQRGVMLKIAPKDIAMALNCRVAAIGRND